MATKKTTGTKTTSSRKPRTTQNRVTPIDRASENGASSVETFPSATIHPGLEEEIRQRAYELYEERGRQDGLHDDDWARAQTEVLQRYRKESA